jgi:hypothetical protein
MSPASLRNPLLRVGLFTLALLVVPALAMQLTSEVNWGPGDFVVAAILLFGAGSLTVLSLRYTKSNRQRAALVLGVALGLALVWAELAVGLFH